MTQDLSGLSLYPVELPDSWEFHCVDDVFIKTMPIPSAGLLVPQHSHKYDHNSMLAVGSVRVWKDGKHIGDFKAPAAIFVEAGCKHMFMSLEPSLLYCIHNVGRMGEIEVLDEHHIFGE